MDFSVIFMLCLSFALTICSVVCTVFVIWRKQSTGSVQADFSGYEQLSQELFQGLERLTRSLEHQNLQTVKEVHEGISLVKTEHHQSLENHRLQIQSPITALTQQLSQLQQWHQQIDLLSHKVYQLTRVLDHSTLKGKFGERQLEFLLGDRYPKSWILMQHVLPTGVRADFVIQPSVNDPLLVIDSKFPVQSFKLVLEHADHGTYMKDFINVMKKNLSDIAEKYIISGVTRSHAILFVPSNAMFFKLLDSEELLDYAQEKNVLICCPQSLYWICDLLQEHYFQTQWTCKQREYLEFLKEGRKNLEQVLVKWDQWDKRCTQLRLDGRHLKKELDDFKGFFEGLDELNAVPNSENPTEDNDTPIVSESLIDEF